MKKGKILCLVLSMLMLVSMFAVAGGQGEAKAPQPQTQVKEEPKELRLVAQAWMLGKYKIEDAAAIFEKDHPGVKVTISKVDNADTTTNMLQWATGKTNSDIALGGSREQAVQYAAKDYIINFDEGFFDDKIRKEDFFPSFLELGNIEGTQYMIPITGEVMFIVVNKTLMKKAGLVDANGKVLVPKT
jgi:ABC-type glycerol-3-phosphate transport system substrate-binding protein